LVGCAILICVVYEFAFDFKDYNERLNATRQRLRSGDAEGARQELLELHQEDESNSEVIELLAQIEMRHGNYSKAIGYFARVTKPRHKACAARNRAARLAMQTGRGRATETMALESIRLDPDQVGPRKLLLRYYFVLLRHRDLCRQSVELDRMGQLSEHDLLMRCVAHRASWDDDDHLGFLEQCMREDPTNAAGRGALARNYSTRDRIESAARVLREAPEGGTEEWPILLTRAELDIAAGRFEQALQSVAKLPSRADGESRAWMARAKVWTETGDITAAKIALENAAKIDPYDPAPSYAMARILIDEGADQEASLHFERARQLRELMGFLSRLLEASNPAYHNAEPIHVIRHSARVALRELGFVREAEILGRACRMDGVVSADQLKAAPPLQLFALEDLARPDRMDNAKNGGRTRGITLPADDQGSPNDVVFQDIATEIDLRFAYDTGNSPYRWLMETLGGGVAVLDFDRDGWDDVYLTQGGPLPADDRDVVDIDRLFQNVEGHLARDVTRSAHLANRAFGQGCAVGDYDNDGFVDLAVCNFGQFLLFRNQGDGTFLDAGKAANIQSTEWSTSAAFSDLDRDGDLDLYVVQYLDAKFPGLMPCKFRGAYTSCRPFGFAGSHDVFWENLGNGTFANSTGKFGLTASDGKGLGVAIVDFNRQGRESIFVGNDTTANFLFQPTVESSTPRFRESAMISGAAVNAQGMTEACMGVAVGDVDRDGRFDLFVTNFQGETNTLYQSSGDNQFLDATERAGLANSTRERLGFGCQFLDVDCDGSLDLFVANGQLHKIPQLPQLYYNSGTGRFRDISATSGEYFSRPRLGRSVARLDWNRDLLADLIVTYQSGNVSLLKNQSDAGNRLTLQCVGVASNRDAAGTVVRAQVDEQSSYFFVSTNGGYFASNDSKIMIGCGAATRIDHLDITWPNGRVVSWHDVPVGRSLVVLEGQDRLWTRAK